MFSVLAMVCVAYLNGLEHCNVRIKYDVTATEVECKLLGDSGVTKLSLDALTDEYVSHIASTSVKCDSRKAIEDYVATIPDYMDSSDTSYVLTEY